MASQSGRPKASHSAATVNPRDLDASDKQNSRPFPSKRFNAEEWETWMEWDPAQNIVPPRSPSEAGSALWQASSLSRGSTSPSETESLLFPPGAPIYRIPSIHTDFDFATQKSDSSPQLAKKRKTSLSEARDVRTRRPKGQKISHNVIEKRYRTNLNDKIARLRDSIPTLKTAFEVNQKQQKKDDADNGSDESEADDKTAAGGVKFNKATVLTKATEYIEQLEKANAKLLSENSSLRRRFKDSCNDAQIPKPLYFRADEANATGNSLCSTFNVPTEPNVDIRSPDSYEAVSGKIPVATKFQRLRAEAADQPSYAPEAPVNEPLTPSPTALGTEETPTTPMSSPPQSDYIDFDSVRGAIPLPDYLRRNRVPISHQQHYAPAMTQSDDDVFNADAFVMDDADSPAWWPRNRASKLLLGSLAGLMIMEGFNTNTDAGHKDARPVRGSGLQKRGMLHLPEDFYTESRGFRAQIRQRIIEFSHTPQAKKAVPILFLALIILGVLFLALVYLNRNDPKARRRANSVSSNTGLEGTDFRVTSASTTKDTSVTKDPTLSQQSQTLTTTNIRIVDLRSKTRSGMRSFVTEAFARFRACWQILAHGHSDGVLGSHSVATDPASKSIIPFNGLGEF